MLEEFKEYAGDTVKRIITYNPKKSGDRANAIKKFRDVMFSVAGIGVATQGMTVDEATAKKE